MMGNIRADELAAIDRVHRHRICRPVFQLPSMPGKAMATRGAELSSVGSRCDS